MKLATINEAAKLLGKSPQQLRRGIKAGRYPYTPIGTRTLVDIDKVQGIIDQEESSVGIQEASELTGLPPATIRRGAKEGWLPCKKTGRAYEFKPGELLAALQNMERISK